MKVTSSGVHLCCRQGCHVAAAEGSGFCEPCGAWLRMNTKEDPLADIRVEARSWGMP